MNQVWEFFAKLFDSSDWPPRWHCGRWTEFHGWLYIVSDLLIWSAYFTIPVVIIKYITRKHETRFIRLYFLFAAFILACGSTHFLDAISFWLPVYRLNALVRLLTAIISWITVFYLVKLLPFAFSLKSQKELETEIENRQKDLQQQQRLLASIVNSSDEAIISVNIDSIITSWNHSSETLFGYSAKEALGNEISMLIAPGRLDEELRIIRRITRGKNIEHYETERIRKDGSIVRVSLNVYPIKDSEGKIIGASINARNIEERLLAQKNQLAGEIRYSALLERITDAFCAFDKSWCYTYINKQGGELMHRSPESLIGKNIWEEFPETIGSGTYNAYNEAIKEQQYICYTNYSPTLSRWLENHLYPSSDGLSVVIRDVTEHKKAEERQALFVSMVTSSEDAIISKDLEGIITSWNPGAERLYGYSSEEAIGQNICMIVPSDRPNEESEIVEMIKKGRRVEHFETARVKKNGGTVYVSLTVSPIKDVSGNIIGASKIARDVTGRKEAERGKEFDRNNLVALINNTKDLMWSVDRDLKLITFNDSFNDIFRLATGYPPAKGDNILSSKFTEDQLEQYKASYARALAGETFTITDHLTYPFESWSEVSFYPMRKGETVIGNACFSHDITEQRKNEISLQAMAQQILDQKVQEQKKMTRAVINAQEMERNHLGQELHDNINQILVSTKLYLSIAGNSDVALKKLVKYPMELLDSSILEIRSLSSRHVTPLKNVYLKELIQVLLDKLKENSTIKTEFVYEMKDRCVDDYLKLNIYRIIQEQINNITKYAASTTVGVSIRVEGKIIHIEISDDGKGFEVRKKRQGIGISNMINRIESFNGKMSIESAPGKGCKMLIEIPF